MQSKKENQLEQFGLDQIRTCLATGAYLNREVIDFFHALDMPLYLFYGTSETTGIISMNNSSGWKKNSSGRLLPGIKLKINSLSS